MARPPARPRPPREPPRRIVVRPEEVAQRDPRPWRRGSLAQVVAGFLAVSAVVVAVGVLVLTLLGFWDALGETLR